MKYHFFKSMVSGFISASLVFIPSSFANTKYSENQNLKIETLKTYVRDFKIEKGKSYSEVRNLVSKRLPAESSAYVQTLIKTFRSEKYVKYIIDNIY